MASRSAVSSATLGASNIQKKFATRPHLIVASVSAVGAGGIAAQLSVSGLGWSALLAWICTGVACGALLRASSAFLTAGIAALGLIAALGVVEKSIPLFAAPLYGGILLAAAEFGYWSFDMRISAPESMATIRSRLGVIVSLVAVGTGASALVVVVLGSMGALGT